MIRVGHCIDVTPFQRCPRPNPCDAQCVSLGQQLDRSRAVALDRGQARTLLQHRGPQSGVVEFLRGHAGGFELLPSRRSVGHVK